MDEIDIVLPWVDPTDPQWIVERRKYSPEVVEAGINQDKYYRDWDTLRYVFRGIEAYMPWIRKIHFLTYGHLPQWLNTDAPKLSIANHRDFFLKESAFPVFNSDAIEMNISGLTDLSERFIYFNDDTLVLKPVAPERFFDGNRPVDSLVQDIPRGGYLYKKFRSNDTYADICLNCVRPLNSYFPLKKLLERAPGCFFHSSYSWSDRLRNRFFNLTGKYTWIKVNHAPQPLLRSAMETCRRLFPEILQETAQSRFRRYSDVCHYLFRNLVLVSGQFKPYAANDSYCMVLSAYDKFKKEIGVLDRKRFVCVNDSQFLPVEDYHKIRPELVDKLNELLPDRSSFEK